MAAPAQPTKDDTFSALSDCFSTDLAALIGEESPRNTSPNGFIDLIIRVRDVLNTTRVSHLQRACDELDEAVAYLTDALSGPDGDQRSFLAWARTHLRDAIETAS